MDADIVECFEGLNNRGAVPISIISLLKHLENFILVVAPAANVATKWFQCKKIYFGSHSIDQWDFLVISIQKNSLRWLWLSSSPSTRVLWKKHRDQCWQEDSRVIPIKKKFMWNSLTKNLFDEMHLWQDALKESPIQVTTIDAMHGEIEFSVQISHFSLIFISQKPNPKTAGQSSSPISDEKIFDPRK